MKPVSILVNRRIIAFGIFTTLALIGCGSVKEQVQRDTFNPEKATTENVAIHVYLDRSGSSREQRAQMCDQLAELLDLYPKSLETTLHGFAQGVDKMNTIFCSRQAVQNAIYDYSSGNDPEPPKGTSLSSALADLRTECMRTPEKQVVGVIVTDGGFEEPDAAVIAATRQLSDMPNIQVLVFTGLKPLFTAKLSKLDAVAVDSFKKGSVTKHVYSVNLEEGGAMLKRAKTAINDTIAYAEKFTDTSK